MAAQKSPRVILLAGPTASGKSALALKLAEKLEGVVVNADSMQVYRDLRVLTSRPPAEDEARAPHRLYGHVDAAEAYSAGRFLDDAARTIADNPGRTLIFVGGTGLYFESLARGLSATPPVPQTVRAYWRDRALSEPPEILHAELARRDPEMAAKLRPSDPQRLARALEVLDSTGRSLAVWQRSAGKPLIDTATAVRIVLTIDRAVVRERIAVRFMRMAEEGALDEVQALLARNLDPSLPAMKAIGVPALAGHLRGEVSLDEAVSQAVTDTRQYAKRQETWFRNRLSNWIHAGAEQIQSLLYTGG
jgi:tRNA dimethylallyltransferase